MGQTSTKPTFTYFSDLPPEIQYKIFELHPDFPGITQYLSKEISLMGRGRYYRDICLRPISKNEFRHFVDTYSHYKIGVAESQLPGQQKYTFGTIEVNSSPGLMSLPVFIRSIHFITELYKLIDELWDLMIYREFDVLVEYEILIKRRSCTNIDPDYAKAMILAKLDRYSQDPNILQRYTYAYINASVLGIIPLDVWQVLSSPFSAAELAKFERESEVLYPLIRQRFLDYLAK